MISARVTLPTIADHGLAYRLARSSAASPELLVAHTQEPAIADALARHVDSDSR